MTTVRFSFTHTVIYIPIIDSEDDADSELDTGNVDQRTHNVVRRYISVERDDLENSGALRTFYIYIIYIVKVMLYI